MAQSTLSVLADNCHWLLCKTLRRTNEGDQIASRYSASSSLHLVRSVCPRPKDLSRFRIPGWTSKALALEARAQNLLRQAQDLLGDTLVEPMPSSSWNLSVDLLGHVPKSTGLSPSVLQRRMSRIPLTSAHPTPDELDGRQLTRFHRLSA